jgi:hypothetical protein
MLKAENVCASLWEGYSPDADGMHVTTAETNAPTESASHYRGLQLRLYATFVAVALLTFAVLVAGYQLLPSDQTFA